MTNRLEHDGTITLSGEIVITGDVDRLRFRL